MRKPLPVNAGDAAALEKWKGETREVLRGLHAVGVDATARLRVYSREELRRRLCRFHKQLGGLVDALQLPGQQAVGDGVGAPDTPPEDLGAPDGV